MCLYVKSRRNHHPIQALECYVTFMRQKSPYHRHNSDFIYKHCSNCYTFKISCVSLTAPTCLLCLPSLVCIKARDSLDVVIKVVTFQIIRHIQKTQTAIPYIKGMEAESKIIFFHYILCAWQLVFIGINEAPCLSTSSIV